MAEAVGAFYAVETAVEGAVAGAAAVSGSTVPLHAKFQKVKSPSEALTLSGSNATIIKNKIFLNGGESFDGTSADRIHVISFKPDFSALTTDSSTTLDVDYESQRPQIDSARRALQTSSRDVPRHGSLQVEHSPSSTFARNKHTSTAIEDRIYVLGGFASTGNSSRASNSATVIPLNNILAFNTLNNTYSVISADPSKCTEGIPEPRYFASCSSSPLPPPISTVEGDGPSLDAHGTIFLHGGYDMSGNALHDTWTFDLGTHAWHKFPTIVEEVIADKAIPGRVAYNEGRLWYVNGSTVMHLELAERDPQSNDVASDNPEVLSTGRVGSGQWQVVYPPAEADPMSAAKPAEKNDAKVPETLPQGATAAIVPITTGSGRQYLLSFSPTNPQKIFLFQLPSSPKTATSLKDTIRDKLTSLTRLPDTWNSGKFQWSKVEVIQASKQEGNIERPSEELTEFAVASWPENGDKVAIWGGRSDSGGVRNEGWVVSFD